jgi:ankyrin repeat protein
LAAGADTDIQNSNGNTALHLAASRGAMLVAPLNDVLLHLSNVRTGLTSTRLITAESAVE